MLILSRIHLIRNPGHAPGRSVVVMIVRVDAHIAAGNIHTCNVVDELLVIPGLCHLDFLGDARSPGGGACGKDLVAGILVHISGSNVQIVGKGIAAGLPNVGVHAVGEV